MKTDLNYSSRTHAYAHLSVESAPPGAATLAGRTPYTCPMHPDTVRDAPGECPECGMTLIPIFEAITRAAMALKSLSAVSNALRVNRV